MASNGDTVRVLAQCAMDLTAAECARCLLNDSVPRMVASWVLTTADGVQVQGKGSVAAVLGSNCYLRLEISAPPRREKIRRIVKDHIVLTVLSCFVVAAAIGALVAHVCCLVMRKARN
ncbi:hypothetical protein ZWY2020_013943 [Hordeum vulgare]|nr:hypothetical protein ZWY2020_013943 [Hordeum vulgare]